MVDDIKLGLLLRRAGKRTRTFLGVDDVECHWGATVWSMVKIMEKNYFAALDYRLWLALAGSVFVILVSAILVLGLMSGTVAGLAAALSPLALILPAGIMARRPGWSWPCAVFMPFMFPVFLYALFNLTFVTLRQGGIRWRETFYPLETLRAVNVRKARRHDPISTAQDLTSLARRNSLRPMHLIARSLSGLLLLVALPGLARDYRFDGSMSEEVLRSYLSRSMTTMYLLTGHGDFDDNLRMLTNCGVKFAGRAVYQWGREEGGAVAIPKKLERAKENATKIHAADPEIILQACIFEIVSRDVNELAVPAWAFTDLNRPVEQRNFRYDDIIYATGRFSNHWGQGSSVPDVSRAETKLWFYFLARSYMDIGVEAIHYGQVELMNGNDPKLDHWAEVLEQARRYAAKGARRHFLMCDAHVPRAGFVRDGKLLFDFHSFPLRIEELPDKPKQAQLRVGYTDALYGRSKGGVTPSGWRCEHLPYLVEFDNYGRSRQAGAAGQGRFWIWGWDEITWFSQQPEKDRNDWLRYAWRWVREHDSEGYVQMPGHRIISGAADAKRWYDVNTRSAATPNGFGQEQTIRTIWAAETNGVYSTR